MPRVAVIINPISGTGGRPKRAGQLLAEVTRLLAARRIEARVSLTETAGHARALAAEAVRDGYETVVAWGGDGTVNEVATTLAFTGVRLAVVPKGSGNGLARGLRIPRNARAALDVAIDGQAVAVDVGELDGRRFVSVAGIGLDAAVAHAFAAGGLRRRGMVRYAELAIREALAYRPQRVAVQMNGRTVEAEPLLLVLANGPQFGGGAVIAPGARLDDGLLDVVVVAGRSKLVALLQAPALFVNAVTRLPGVSREQAAAVTISARVPLRYHVDGEPCEAGTTTVHGTIHPRALRVMVPQPTKR